MKCRDQLFFRACAALPPSASQALATARLFPGDDESDLSPGAAWLLVQGRNSCRAPSNIAKALQSQARRGRAGAVIGAAGKKQREGEQERQDNALALRAATACAPSPLDVLLAIEHATAITQEEAACAGVAALLDSLKHAPGSELARSLGVSSRRGQQIRAWQRGVLALGQLDLFAAEEFV